ncbi:N-acetylmuramoyl-L-alanine amidase-like domain-containing protein [Vibrio aquimaris]|uniref:DUF1460 domain-containing protein n=1 Tax=Vibrio aquimaris TaxID=2587862 RepID=A0A5P9CQB3_9VIBR|nr:N-acetylmuramoyl-L-alanine amidase-like domain-containing protein [Vibrio aquimaris]QFT28435.1 hypothetical protein FIV01_18735 [Vibrio aquimaris]
MKQLTTLLVLCVSALSHSASAWNTESSSRDANNSETRLFSDYASFYTLAQARLEAIIDTEQLPISDKIRQLSSVFIDVPYAANRMIGSQNTDEQLVIKLGELDCFTYLDYVEALRKSEQLDDFKDNLIQTRYINGKVDFKTRRHFFSDWVSEEAYNAIDITAELSNFFIKVTKNLNQKENGDLFLVGLPIKRRDITYIPSDKVDEDVIKNMRDGDYVGTYSNVEGV